MEMPKFGTILLASTAKHFHVCDVKSQAVFVGRYILFFKDRYRYVTSEYV